LVPFQANIPFHLKKEVQTKLIVKKPTNSSQNIHRKNNERLPDFFEQCSQKKGQGLIFLNIQAPNEVTVISLEFPDPKRP